MDQISRIYWKPVGIRQDIKISIRPDIRQIDKKIQIWSRGVYNIENLVSARMFWLFTGARHPAAEYLANSISGLENHL